MFLLLHLILILIKYSLFCHGNGENSVHCLPITERQQWVYFEGKFSESFLFSVMVSKTSNYFQLNTLGPSARQPKLSLQTEFGHLTHILCKCCLYLLLITLFFIKITINFHVVDCFCNAMVHLLILLLSLKWCCFCLWEGDFMFSSVGLKFDRVSPRADLTNVVVITI